MCVSCYWFRKHTSLFFFCTCREEYIDFGPVKRIRRDYPMNEISSFLGGPFWVSTSTTLNVRKEKIPGFETPYSIHKIWRGKKFRNPAVVGETSQQNRRWRKCICQRFVFKVHKYRCALILCKSGNTIWECYRQVAEPENIWNSTADIFKYVLYSKRIQFL